MGRAAQNCTDSGRDDVARLLRGGLEPQRHLGFRYRDAAHTTAAAAAYGRLVEEECRRARKGSTLETQNNYKANGKVTDEMRKVLRMPMDDRHIERMEGRDYLSYIKVEYAVETANRIFGNANWYYEVTSEPVLREIEGYSAVAQADRMQAYYTCRVAVYLFGVKMFEDAGLDIVEEPKDGRIPDAGDHETAYKGSIANGLKRALRGFGPQFGNSLYAKGAIWTEELLRTWLQYDVMEVSPEMRELLATSLDPKYISSDGDGSQYLPGYMLIDQANRIFGEGNWWYQLTADPELHLLETTNAVTGEIRRQHYYTAPVQLYLFGKKVFDDVGFNIVSQPRNGRTPDVRAHDSKFKGSVTNAMKRAMRPLGNQFGNSVRSGVTGAVAVAAGPACPKHGAGRNIRESSRHNGYYCTRRDNTTESGYCEYETGAPAPAAPSREMTGYSQPAASAAQGHQRMPAPSAPATAAPATADTAMPTAPARQGAPAPASLAASAPSSQPAAAQASPNGKAPRQQELIDEYVAIGERCGRNKGQIFTGFLRLHKKPITQATPQELSDLIKRAKELEAAA